MRIAPVLSVFFVQFYQSSGLLRYLKMASNSAVSLKPRIFVAGATGRTGQRIVQQLEEEFDCHVIVASRLSSQAKANALFQNASKINILNLDMDADIQDSLEGCDVVICALGTLESEPFNWKGPYSVDGQLTQKFISAATRSKTVKHFILISSLGTDRIGFPASILNLFWGILSWKRQSEQALIKSGLRYTIVRPGGMERPTDDFELTHNMRLAQPSTQFGGSISRRQIAQLCCTAAMYPDVSSDRIVEVTADPSYPRKSALELLSELPKIISESEWKSRLSNEEFYVLREAGTERPWTSALNNEKRDGIFTCAGCGNDLFDAATKFESGTGWPSFFAPIEKTAVNERLDFLLGLARTEVLCSCCGGHLGHVFPDGPRPTGQRYCMNGIALKFKPLAATRDTADSTEQLAGTQAQRIATRMELK